MYLDGVQEVPCSKGGVFKNKLLGLKEKRGLMKFLTSIMQPTEQDTQTLQEFQEKPFLEFLQSQQLSANVIKFILYSIVNEENDQEKATTVNTADAMARLKLFTSSIGRYGSTPYLVPLYGSGELPQAYCRLSAVYGAIFVLARTTQSLEILDNKCVSIETETEKISCEHLVGSWEHLPNFVKPDSPIFKVSRAIIVSDVPLLPLDHDTPNDLVALSIPPNTFGNTCNISVQQLTDSVGVAAPSFYLIHFTTPSTSPTAKEDLQGSVEGLFQHLSSRVNPEEGKAGIIWRSYFNILDPEIQADTPTNVHVVSRPFFSLTYDQAMKKAEEIFHKLCPEEEFIPKVPNPEDIIFEVGPEKEEEKTEVEGEVEGEETKPQGNEKQENEAKQEQETETKKEETDEKEGL
eukprot:TRINITY_DN1543_c0_g1_i1.p1 TRINITY_DN1543_c0_g1~~TRINITY_DN1543_c0_g1_i1.p1  ORF type:complete len:405 (+),score=132.44 TRINITY_DN1543_c0_g1_i1:577-1791(+)